MENLSYREAPATTHVVAPYAEQMLAMVHGKIAQISEDIKSDPASLSTFFQGYLDIAHALQKDGEFNYVDLLHIREGIEGLRQQALSQIASVTVDAAFEAA